MAEPTYRNRAHRSAYAKGEAAAANGRHRMAPYDASNRSSMEFRSAWLAGYDAETERMRERSRIEGGASR